MRYSAAAILTVGDRYVLQLRDASAAIAFPAHWGLFGGEVDKGESPLDAIRREINEELALDVAEWREVGSFAYAAVSGEPSHSVIFAADITDRWASHLLREGEAAGMFHFEELPTPIIPLALTLISHYHVTRPQRVAP